MKYPYFFAIILAIFCLFFQATKVSAAELFLKTTSQTFAQGDEFLVNVYLNTAEDSVNTVQAKVIFPDNLLQLKEIRNGNSIINFWIASPAVSKSNVINFSGIITGGYKGTSGFLFSAVFTAESSGNGVISFDSVANVLLNDGKGTQADLKFSPLQISVSKKTTAVKTIIEPVKDVDPPEDFTPEVMQNSEMFGGKYFLVFVAQDNGSGIDHYEIQETRDKQQGNNWIIATSPYVLQDQSLQSFIYVKAVDKSGNEKIEKMRPATPALKWYEIWFNWFIIKIISIWKKIFLK